MKWAVYSEERVKGSRGLAIDELGLNFYKDFGDCFLHIYTFSPPCAVLGYHQDINVLEEEKCQKLGVEITRRLTGGGCVLMTETTVGIGVCSKEIQGNPFSVCQKMSEFIIETLNSYSIKAVLTPRNDIQVKGKKIAGVGIYRDESGNMLFHCSLLLDFNFDMMVEILRGEGLKRKEEEARKRITTLYAETGKKISFQDLIERIIFTLNKKYETKAININSCEIPFNKVETLAISKYENPKWIKGETLSARKKILKFRSSNGIIKLSFHLTENNVIKDVKVHSDVFFAPLEITSYLTENLSGRVLNDGKIAELLSLALKEKVKPIRNEIEACFFKVPNM